MNTPAPQLSPAKVAAAPVAALLPLDQVNPDPQQPRKAFDEAALNELAASIKAEGLINPIVVKPNGKGYHIVDGERRYRAAKLAGLKEVPSLIRADLKDQDVTALQLVANLQREDLTLPEQCDAIVRLVKTLGTAGSASASPRPAAASRSGS
jgi:ParB family transcriptional regulator, chromosome partitioning protein